MFIFAFILIAAMALIVFVRSEWGRSFAARIVNDWLAKEYQVKLFYDSVQIQTLPLGWELRFRELRWDRVNAPEYLPGKIRELRLDVNPWSLIDGSIPVSAIVVKGAQLQVQVEVLHKFFQPSSSGNNQLLAEADLRFEDVEVELIYGTDERAQFTLAADWSAGWELESFQLKSPGFSLIPFTKQMLEFFKKEGFPGLDKIRQGQVEQLQLDCAGLKKCHGSVWLRKLQWESFGWVPGTRDLSVFVEFQPQEVHLRIPEGQYRLAWPSVYSHSVQLGLAEMNVDLRLSADQLLVNIPKTKLLYNGLPVTAQSAVGIPLQEPQNTRLQLALHSAQVNWEILREALPDEILGTQLYRWLSQSLQHGRLRQLTGKVEGEVRHFPFSNPKQGHFEVHADFEEIQVHYQEGWPSLEHCGGHFKMHRASIQVENIQCSQGEVDVSNGSVMIPQFSPLEIQIQAKASSSFKSALAFMKASPLRGIADFLASVPLEAQQQETDLHLSYLPEQPLQLKGHTHIAEVKINLPPPLYNGSADTIDLEFDQNGLSRVHGTLKSSDDNTRVSIQRDAANKYLDIALEPVDEQPRALRANLRAAPAAAPESIVGTVSSYKLRDAALVSLDRIAWKASQPKVLEFKGKAQVKDFAKCLNLLKLDVESKGGHGTIGFDLSLPVKASENQNLIGQVDFDLADGHLEKLPDVATALINFANLKVFGIRSDSLTYSFLKGHLNFGNGILQVKDSALELGAIEVQAIGAIDYRRHTMQLDLQIIPDLGSPAAAVAIGTWSPLVGITLFGLSKFHGNAADSRLNRAISQTYRLAGSTADPKIKLIKPMDLREIVRWSRD